MFLCSRLVFIDQKQCPFVSLFVFLLFGSECFPAVFLVDCFVYTLELKPQTGPGCLAFVSCGFFVELEVFQVC